MPSTGNAGGKKTCDAKGFWAVWHRVIWITPKLSLYPEFWMYWQTKEWAHTLQAYFRNTSAGKTGTCRRLQGMASPSPTATPFPLQCSSSLFVSLYRRAHLITAPVFSTMFYITKAFPITQASFNNWGFQTLPIFPLKHRCGYVKTDPWQSSNTLLNSLCPRAGIWFLWSKPGSHHRQCELTMVWDKFAAITRICNPLNTHPVLLIEFCCFIVHFNGCLMLPQEKPAKGLQFLCLSCFQTLLCSHYHLCQWEIILFAVSPEICRRSLQSQHCSLSGPRSSTLTGGDVRNECPGSAACFCLQRKREVP